jgi:hypothetical protein
MQQKIWQKYHNTKFAVVQGVIQEKSLNTHKNSVLCDILIFSRVISCTVIIIFIFYCFSTKQFLFIYSHVHTLFGPFLPPAPYPLPLPFSPSHFQAEPVLPYSPILL